MTKKIHIYAFDMNCVSHINHGLWTHPRDQSTSYTSLEYWANLARTAERGKLDGIFLADIVGVYDVYKGGPATAISTGAQTPVNDPLLVVPVMAYVIHRDMEGGPQHKTLISALLDRSAQGFSNW